MDIEEMEIILTEAFNKLIENDKDLVKLPSSEYKHTTDPEIYSEETMKKLHEVCINNRLAFYIENIFLEKYQETPYKIDIEYNKNYYHSKKVKIDGTDVGTRPDIIIHTRTQKTSFPQHLLIIEAKKEPSNRTTVFDSYDEKKIKAFMNDEQYNYNFGLAVIYGDFIPIKTRLFFHENKKITYKDLDFKPTTSHINQN